jgi:hypothetical protein
VLLQSLASGRVVPRGNGEPPCPHCASRHASEPDGAKGGTAATGHVSIRVTRHGVIVVNHSVRDSRAPRRTPPNNPLTCENTRAVQVPEGLGERLRVVGSDFLVHAKPEQFRYGHLAYRRPTLMESVICTVSGGKPWRPVRVMLNRKVLAHANE